jgi:hypothetical protein
LQSVVEEEPGSIAHLLECRHQSDVPLRLLSSPGFLESVRAYHPRCGEWRSFSLGPSGACFVDGEVQRARLFLSHGDGRDVARRLDGVLSILLRLSLVQHGGLLLHAAGVSNGDGAYVFLGPSGSGKTTIAQAARARGWSVLADDGLIVRRSPDGWFGAFRTPWNAMGPPWHGSFGDGPDRAAIRAVFFQRHGDVDRWEQLGPPVSSVRMVEAAFPTLKQLEGWNPGAALALLAELSREVSCYDLRFSIGCGFFGQIED